MSWAAFAPHMFALIEYNLSIHRGWLESINISNNQRQGVDLWDPQNNKKKQL